VLGEQLQHVIEEADAGGDFVAAAAFDAQFAAICVSLVLRSILAVRGKRGLQRIDVVEHGDCAFARTEAHQFVARGCDSARRCR
jgi:hypothetical protein